MLHLSSGTKSRLSSDACDALRQGHDDAWNDIKLHSVARPQWEPRFVAHLCGAMINVASQWKPTLRSAHPGVRLSATAVFTHQTPYVKWGSQRCELADLLLAFIDRTGSNQHGIAVLIQAKQADHGSVTLSGTSERTQFDLLSTRPIFDVDQLSAPTAVDLSSQIPDTSLLYGLTPPTSAIKNLPPWSNHRWHTRDGLASIKGTYAASAHQCLADTLVEMVYGLQGWSFDLPPPGHTWSYFAAASRRDDWSMLINFLLEKTFATTLTSLQSAIGGSTRGADHAMYLQGRTPSGKTTFLQALIAADLPGRRPLDWIKPDPLSAQSWLQVSNSPLFELGTGGGGGGDIGGTDAAGPDRENGPLSAIVFELSRGDDSKESR